MLTLTNNNHKNYLIITDSPINPTNRQILQTKHE